MNDNPIQRIADHHLEYIIQRDDVHKGALRHVMKMSKGTVNPKMVEEYIEGWKAGERKLGVFIDLPETVKRGYADGLAYAEAHPQPRSSAPFPGTDMVGYGDYLLSEAAKQVQNLREDT